MKKFQAANWDEDSHADAVCKELFKDKSSTKIKEKKKTKIKLTTTVDSSEKIQKKNLVKFPNTSKKLKIKHKINLALPQVLAETRYNQQSKKPLIKSPKEIKKLETNDKKMKLKSKLINKLPNCSNNKETKNVQKPSNITKINKKQKIRSIDTSAEQQVIRKSGTKLKQQPMMEERKKLNPFKMDRNKYKSLSLRERLETQLKSAHFRYLNEIMYSNTGKKAEEIFKNDQDSFKAYHDGFRQQVSKWPINPLDLIIKSIKKLPKTYVIADFGCGDARLAASVDQKVHSFDFIAINNEVIECDMARVPLENNSVDVVVFCLSLMGTNLHDYILEANRVLKVGGLLKISEVESRFDNINNFIEGLKHFHFKNMWKDLSHNLFYFMDFKKEMNVKNKKKLPTISLNPCIYKKR